MGDALAQRPRPDQALDASDQRLARQRQVDLGAAVREPAAGVRAHGRLELLEAQPRVVEARDRLEQARGGQVAELREEAAEGVRGGARVSGAAHHVAALGAFDQAPAAPGLAVLVQPGEGAVARRHELEHAALEIAHALPLERAALVGHHARDVRHHLRRLAEDALVDALLHVARAPAVGLELGEQRLVDVPAAEGRRREPAALDREGLGHALRLRRISCAAIHQPGAE